MKLLKIGDTLSSTIRLYDANTKSAILLDETIMFICDIKDAYNKLISHVDVEILDQLVYPGLITLNVNSEITNTWKEGHASLDFRIIINGDVVITTDTVSFKIISPETTRF